MPPISSHPCLPILAVAFDGFNADLSKSSSRNVHDRIPLEVSVSDHHSVAMLLAGYKSITGRLPVPGFSLKRYLESIPPALHPTQDLSSNLEGLAHFICVGVWHGAVFMSMQKTSSLAANLRTGFDPSSYRASLEMMGIDLPHNTSLFRHYLGAGCCLGLSPAPSYCETSYILRYPDILRAISSGRLHCGFSHYLRHGMAEKRNAEEFDSYSYLQRFYPSLLHSRPREDVEMLSRFTCFSGPPPFRQSSHKTKSLLLALHAIDCEIKFGGMSALYRIVDSIVSRFDINYIDLILTDQPAGAAGALYQITRPDHPLSKYLQKIRLYSLFSDESGKLCFELGAIPLIAEDTIAIAYNAKAAYILNGFRLNSQLPSFQWYYLIQEDESSFFGGGSLSAAIRYTYTMEFMPIYNSVILEKYMKKRYSLLASRGGHSFSHQYILPEKPVLRSEKENIIICYFRPEKHADRNCHEIISLALIHCLRERPSLNQWKFVGIGSLTNFKLPLTDSVEMECFAKLSYASYSSLLRSAKIGISLMDAPHPSVVPFEMAGHGVTVITNSHFCRSDDDIKGLSPQNKIRLAELNYAAISGNVLDLVDEWERIPESSRPVSAESEPTPLSMRWKLELQELVEYIQKTKKL